MRKFKSILVLLIIATVFLSACSDGDDSDSNGAPDGSEFNNEADDSVLDADWEELTFRDLFDETAHGHANFRNAMWGMSIEEVILMEDDEPHTMSEAGLLIYEVEAPNSITEITYLFDDNELTLASYIRRISPISDDTDYYREYRDLIDKFISIYGEPHISEVRVLGDLYQYDEPQNWNEALAGGHISLVSMWETQHTELIAGVMNWGDFLEITVLANIANYVFPERPEHIPPLPPAIGMTEAEARNSTWGRPTRINRTTTRFGVREQWVYRNNRFLYFDDGILTAIQDSIR